MAYDENDSYLKKGMKDESEKTHALKKNVYGNLSRKVNVPTRPKNGIPKKMGTPVLKKGTVTNPKKAALGSMLGSLSSGANFKN
jgi:hypothetical protein